MPITRTFLAGLLVALSCRSSPAQEQNLERIISETLKDLRGEAERLEPPRETTSRSIAIEFSAPPRSEPVSGRSVSADLLRHVVPKEAKKAVDSSLKSSARGEYAKAHRALTVAIAADPEFPDAYNALGVLYARETRYGDAEVAFRRALSLDPEAAAVHYNLGLTYLLAGYLPAAEQSARQALSTAPTDNRAHMLLGYLLAANADKRAEAMEHLQAAARTIPEAKKILKQLTK